jgi:ribosome-associated toxin RatA of RatAB toxin-antitoxin module
MSTSLPAHKGPIIHVRVAPDGRPLGAATTMRIERPVAAVWAVLSDIERYAGRLPMVDRARRRGDHVDFDLKFRVGLFSAGFEFSAHATYEEPNWLELRWTSGEPRGVRFRYTLTPLDDGAACLVEGDAEFDVQSLGWLVKYFLKHHPEIQHGIFPGVSLVLIDTLRRIATGG